MSVRWRTKTAACLVDRTKAKSVEQGIVRLVAKIKQTANDQGYTKGTLTPPYDPKPLAIVLGASEVRSTALDFDGHVMEENGKVVVEYDSGVGSGRRKRFTIAHEVGHLALWDVTSDKRKLPARRSAVGSEIEQLCNKIAAEILAPCDEVIKLNGVRAREGFSKADLVLKLTEHFDISLNFAALRFKEVSKRHIGVGLLSVPEKRFEWCHGIASKFMLLNRLISTLPSRQAVGASSYSIDTPTGIHMIPVEWKSLSEGRYLIITSG